MSAVPGGFSHRDSAGEAVQPARAHLLPLHSVFAGFSDYQPEVDILSPVTTPYPLSSVRIGTLPRKTSPQVLAIVFFFAKP